MSMFQVHGSHRTRAPRGTRAHAGPLEAASRRLAGAVGRRARRGLPALHGADPLDGADPAKVEAERYDALYGSRTGTVDNIAPLADGREA